MTNLITTHLKTTINRHRVGSFRRPQLSNGDCKLKYGYDHHGCCSDRLIALVLRSSSV